MVPCRPQPHTVASTTLLTSPAPPAPPPFSSSFSSQWDVWISRGNGPEMEERAKKFVVDMAVARLEEGSDAQVIHIYM